MKNFFKKLAFVLALAMVVTAIAPAAKANAAKAPVLNATSKKIYIGGDYTGKYSDTFTLKVWNKGDYRVTFASSDTKIATVTKWYGVVTAKAVGTATITATVSNKTTGKLVKKLSAKVYVKKNADSVAFGSLAKFDQPLTIGDKVKINVARKAGTVSAWKQADKTQITDYVVWSSSNKDVATVDKWGTVKAVGAGETTISAVATQIEGKVATTTPATVKVTVNAKGIVSIDQKTANKLEITFGVAQDTEKVTKDSIIVTPSDPSKVTPIIKSVDWNSEKTVATVAFYMDLQDKAVYTLSVKDTENAKDFTASVGDVTSITITKPSRVVENSESVALEYVLKDANGVEVSKATNSRVEFTVLEGEANGYVTSDNKVGIFEKGKTMVVKATYYTGEVNTNGEEIKIESAAFTITGVSINDTLLSTVKQTIAKDAVTDWDNNTEKNTLALGDSNYKVQAFVKTSSDKKYNTNDNLEMFTFESMDNSKVEVDSDGTLYPIALGTAYVKVTVSEFDKAFMVKVVVSAARKATTISYDKLTDTVSNTVDSDVAFKPTVKDQYGDDFALTASNTSANHNNTLASSVGMQFDTNSNTFKADFLGEATGLYSYKVKIGDIERVVSVQVKAPATTDVTDSSVKKLFVVSDTAIDLAVNKDNLNKDITFKLYYIDKYGVKISKVNTADYYISISTPNNETIKLNQGVNNEYNLTAVSKSAIGEVTKNNGNGFLKKTGTYSVTAYNTKDEIILKKVFTVTDSQKAPVVKTETRNVQVSTSASLTVLDVLKNKKVFSASTANNGTVKAQNSIVAVEGKVILDNVSTDFKGDYTFTKNGSYKVIITKVTVREYFENETVYFDHVVSKTDNITVVIN